MADKMSVVVYSGSPDRMLGLSMLCSGAIAQDYEVDIYLMLWGCHAFRKDMVSVDSPYAEFDDMRQTVKANAAALNMQPWHEMLADLKEMGELRIHLCSTAPKLIGVEMEDLLDIVDDVVGVVEIISACDEANVHFLI
jgi:peroxiredoxin family protein